MFSSTLRRALQVRGALVVALSTVALSFGALSCGGATTVDAGPSTPTVEYVTEQEILRFCRRFGQVQLEKRHLFYMLKRLAKLPRMEWHAELEPRPLWQALSSLDQQILRLRPLRDFCGEVIVYLKK